MGWLSLIFTDEESRQSREAEDGPFPELKESSPWGKTLPSLEKGLLVRGGGTGKADGLTTKATLLL